ncbi:mitochondrial tRNA methylthiotransferase CDK5RAP1 [Nilaparvata lugens]|uniref:mitochondrial tRNA methylthiotransferase CDK5RAP1 n=1 Tax=Nilaparvata lugens TaxID=108931 RepID=UPI00193D788F|nr:mitochondrial tRNA methylthiotransferase CDK5RAP1 [Nilaparvata lugens]
MLSLPVLQRIFSSKLSFMPKLVFSSCWVNLKHVSIVNCESQNKNLPKTRLKNGPDLKHFLLQTKSSELTDNALSPEHEDDDIPYVDVNAWNGWNRKVYFEVYGCQMNVNDTDIVWSILKAAGFEKTKSISEADVILLMTCAIREGAENRIWGRLADLRLKKRQLNVKIGVLGCMAERLKHQLIEKEKSVDLVAGPDSYRDLPRLLALTQNNQSAVNVLLSLDETYADVMPTRLNEDSVTAFVSIQRGCDNMCTYCIVPFTRGRERSRPVESIVAEVQKFSDEGVKEVTLLGQNVNSYRDTSVSTFSMNSDTNLAKGFGTVYKSKKGGLRFAELLDRVSCVNPEMRIRFISPHPKDFPDEVLHLIAERTNICNNLHMPVQCGNNRVLEMMRRGYTREAYLDLITNVRSIIPDVALSSDFICGFCSETEEEFQDTLKLIEEVKFTNAYLFAYSLRQKTPAHRKFKDDVDPKVKIRRLTEMSNLYRKIRTEENKKLHGQIHLVLVEGTSKRSENDLEGRNDWNQKVIFPLTDTPDNESGSSTQIKKGNYVAVEITDSTSQTLKGVPLYRTTLQHFNQSLRQRVTRNASIIS